MFVKVIEYKKPLESKTRRGLPRAGLEGSANTQHEATTVSRIGRGVETWCVTFRASRAVGKIGPTAYGPPMGMEPFSQEREWSGGIYGQACGGWFYPLWLAEHAETRKAQIQHG